MKFLTGLCMVIYQFGVLPMAAGILLCGGRAALHKICLYGYVAVFAAFYIAAVPVIVTVNRLSFLAKLWGCLLLLSAPGLSALGIIRRKSVVPAVAAAAKNVRCAWGKLRGYVSCMLVVLLFAAVFCVPSEKDNTVETVKIAMETDSMYHYQPYTQIPYDSVDLEKAISPAEMLYAVTAVLSGIEPTILVHTILPFFLLPFFFAVCWFAGRYFFGKNIQKTGLFAVFVILFYSVGLSAATVLDFGVLQSPWNGVSMAVACGIPMALVQAFRLTDVFGRTGKLPKRGTAAFAGMVCALQLMIPEGGLAGCVIVLCCAGIHIWKKGLRNAGIITKR